MHPNGQIPAYEFAFGDVNPPVHAWAAWRVYKMTGPRGQRDRAFLESAFQKLLLNFTWWVNRKDAEGNNLFSGGFLGLDNIGVFDRSKPLPTGGFLQQADGTAWMGFYCLTMLSMALELAEDNPIYEDMASKFFEHFIGIADAMNTLGGTGLWDEEDGFYYDQLKTPGGREIPLRTRSLVGLLPLIAVEVLENAQIEKLPGFKKRMDWFLNYRKDLRDTITYCEPCPAPSTGCSPCRPKTGWSARCATCSTKMNFSRPSACARSRVTIAIIPTSSAPATRNIGSIMFRAKARATFSAATPTGADRSGSRSIT